MSSSNLDASVPELMPLLYQIEYKAGSHYLQVKSMPLCSFERFVTVTSLETIKMYLGMRYSLFSIMEIYPLPWKLTLCFITLYNLIIYVSSTSSMLNIGSIFILGIVYYRVSLSYCKKVKMPIP